MVHIFFKLQAKSAIMIVYFVLPIFVFLLFVKQELLVFKKKKYLVNCDESAYIKIRGWKQNL